jgi:hypothetical protein
MHMHKLLLVLLLALAAASTGCALRPHGTAPWDPKPSASLLDQLPNWDNAARRRCGAHLREQDRSPGMTDRC